MDTGRALTVDASGYVYIAGISYATWSSPVRAYTSGSDVFAAKLDGGGSLLWNTFLGSADPDSGASIAVKDSGNIYVQGWSGLPWGTPIRAYSGATDIFIAQLNTNGVLRWNTFLGGAGSDIGRGIAVDDGNIYSAGDSDATWESPIHAHVLLHDAYVAKTDDFRDIFRSVGPGNTTALATGSGNDLNLVASTAGFSNNLPDNIGVGDAIQYDSDGNGSIDSIAFIRARKSSVSYLVQNASGGTPVQTLGADRDWSVFRAYTSLANAAAASENPGIDSGLADFDPVAYRDLISYSETLNLACYGDAVDSSAVILGPWNTSADTYVRIFSPVLPSEVGQSQRHDGKYSTSAYRLELADTTCLDLPVDHIRIEGLQIAMTSVSTVDRYNIWIHNLSPGDIRISHCLIQGATSTRNGHYGITLNTAGSGTLSIFNNIIYDFSSTNRTTEGINIDDPDFTVYIYNNTVDSCRYGIYVSTGNVVAKNNLVQNSVTDGYVGAFDATSTNNLSDLAADAPGLNPFDSTNVTYLNEAANDYHLLATDTGAKDQGSDLLADSNLPIFDDIDGSTRVVPLDIGADESILPSTPTFTPTCTPTPTPSSTSTNTPTRTPSASPSSTFTSTETATHSPTRTPTSTDTPAGSSTPTPTKTSTATMTHTPTETSTITSSFTPTATSTSSMITTMTCTQTGSPTFSPTPTMTLTQTLTPAPTATSTPTATPSPTPTLTLSPSATRSSTATHTPDISSTPSRTPSIGLSPTLSPTRTSSSTRTSSPSVTCSPTPSPVLSATVTATQTPTHNPAFFTSTPTPVSSTQDFIRLRSHLLHVNRGDSLALTLSMSQAGQVNIQLYDLSGRRVMEIMDSQQPAGTQLITRDLSALGSGTYVLLAEAGGQRARFKLVVLR